MKTCTRRIQFCAGHRVMGHENKCAHLHGHNYVVFITASMGGDLDSIGRVVDFSVLKTIAGGWIEKNWDHGFILDKSDRAGISSIMAFNESMLNFEKETLWNGNKLYLLPCNPTAENIAAYLLNKFNELFIDHPFIITSVRVQETENCEAEAFSPRQIPTEPI